LTGWIEIRGAGEHNLRSVDVRIPRHALTVVTGVSGSGKSSLAFDTVFREGQRRYISALSSFARQFLGKLHRPIADHFAGLPPALAVDQRTTVRNPRSTVGTLTEVYDHLRLLFARLGKARDDVDARLHLGLFSFNSVDGACPECHGLAVTDHVDPELLIHDPKRTLRQGALVPTTKSGYIVYSQVTVEVLDEICRAHGFDVDTPWCELSEEHHRVIFHGSRRLKVPFGKHPLESRMRWSGITARPRDEGYYKGLISTITETLARNRNKNVLRFVRSIPCVACGGTRLQPSARGVSVAGMTIPELIAMSLVDLRDRLAACPFPRTSAPIAEPILTAIDERLAVLLELGLGYLELGRESTSLSGGEAQRIRLASQIGSGLHGLLYVLDEPSISLHPRDTHRLLGILRRLRDLGNTILCVEHDADTIAAADHLIDLGPGAGVDGGEVQFQGSVSQADASPTWAWLARRRESPLRSAGRAGDGTVLTIRGATAHNLRSIEVSFRLGALNVVTGVSGAGKSTLVDHVLARGLRRHLQGASPLTKDHATIEGMERVTKLIHIDAAPIGRTPRSNPATYTNVLDPIRDLFAAQPDAIAASLGRSHFSMNVAGGRCETCHGAGHLVIGMHGLADVEVSCSDCGGHRFGATTLAVRYRDRNIADVLAMSVTEACELFADQPTITRILTVLEELGLGYIHLGQSATTLSGGEAQRIKLATELARPAGRGHTVYILDEPTTGLHGRDVDVLLAALHRLVDQGQTAIVVEHDQDFVRSADHVIDLGPGAGSAGGTVVFAGTPVDLIRCGASATGQALASPRPVDDTAADVTPVTSIELRGVTTNNLQGLDVTIPHRALTVVTGVSGSGKSSLAFDTIFAEGRRRFAENLTTQTRRYLPNQSKAKFEHVHGLTPTLAIQQRRGTGGRRSTVGTMTEIHDYLRLLFARAGAPRGEFTARMFSFNQQEGACADCGGTGIEAKCDPDKLVTDPSLSLFDGAMDGHKTGRFYGERDGQYLAVLGVVEREFGVDLHRPYRDLDPEARNLAMFGCGDREFEVTWKFRRGKRHGEHSFTGKFLGLARYVDEEYRRKKLDRRGEAIAQLLRERVCPSCSGTRLRPETRAVTFCGRTIAEVCALPVTDIIEFFANEVPAALDHTDTIIAAQPRAEILRRSQFLGDLGVGYLALDREAPSLSGGETQRVRLATQLGTRLTGVTYVLDEPTVGLHPHDTRRLIDCLRTLLNDDGTVIVVEHDPQIWAAADHVLTLGPGAGANGGTIVAAGPPDRVPPPTIAALPARDLPAPRLRVTGAVVHNLRGVDIELPLGGLVGITGVSGSGKSSLAMEVLAASVAAHGPVGCDGFESPVRFAAVVRSDTRRGAIQASMPVTHLGIFDRIRKLFAGTDRAREIGLRAGAFSPATKATRLGGRCETCHGEGTIRTDMDFLADTWHTCEACEGQRFAPSTLECRWRDRSIADVLTMSVDDAITFFDADARIRDPLATLSRVGLGYLTLGQPGDTLSGGESQRLGLATDLTTKRSRRAPGPRLYVFDEPTTGLHARDVERLLPVLRELTETGDTVLVVEHSTDVIRNCDWVIDLGPEGGASGGELIYAGPPAGLASCPRSLTGRYV
jgi:excinuclease ABC subunit A